jgi:hypothetical protein
MPCGLTPLHLLTLFAHPEIAPHIQSNGANKTVNEDMKIERKNIHNIVGKYYLKTK